MSLFIPCFSSVNLLFIWWISVYVVKTSPTAHKENIRAIKAILRIFELASGLKINFAKSCFGAIGMSERWTSEAARCLNCSQLSFPFVYLGIPIGANPRRDHMWEPIINKCERALAKWKQRHLSFGGRVTLIQSFLTSIPIYYLSFFFLSYFLSFILTYFFHSFFSFFFSLLFFFP